MNTVEVNLGKRNSSIELLRIVAMVTIVYFHFHAHGTLVCMFWEMNVFKKRVYFFTLSYITSEC